MLNYMITSAGWFFAGMYVQRQWDTTVGRDAIQG